MEWDLAFLETLLYASTVPLLSNSTPTLTRESKHPYPHCTWEQLEDKEGYMTVSRPPMQEMVRIRILIHVGLSLNLRSFEACE